MRLIATLLLLCALAYDQFRVHAQLCTKPTISGPGQLNELYYEYLIDGRIKRLACQSQEKAVNDKKLLALVLNSKHYEFLTCDHEGWKSSEGKIVADSSSPLRISSCVKYCATSLNSIINANVHVGDHSIVKQINCPRKTTDQFFNTASGLFHQTRFIGQNASVYCNLGGWIFGTDVITSDIATPQQFKCKQPCSFYKIDGDVISSLDHETQNTAPTLFRCKGGKHYGIRLNEGSKFSEIKCHLSSDENMNGYIANGVKLAGPYDEVKFTCSEFCDRSLITGSAEIDYDNLTKILSCRSNQKALKAIVINSKRFASLKCNPSEGWKSGNEKVADASSLLNIECVEYCNLSEQASSGIKTVVQGDHKHISCEQNTFGLLHDSSLINDAKCNLEGWRLDDKHITNDITAPLQIECTPICTSFQLSNDAESSVDTGKGETVFKCKQANYEIRLNEGPMVAEIKCSRDGGYAGGGSKLAEPFHAVKFTCRERTTTSTSASATTVESKPVVGQASTDYVIVIGISVVGVLIVSFLIIAAILVFKRQGKKGKNEEVQANNSNRRSKKDEQHSHRGDAGNDPSKPLL